MSLAMANPSHLFVSFYTSTRLGADCSMRLVPLSQRASKVHRARADPNSVAQRPPNLVSLNDGRWELLPNSFPFSLSTSFVPSILIPHTLDSTQRVLRHLNNLCSFRRPWTTFKHETVQLVAAQVATRFYKRCRGILWRPGAPRGCETPGADRSS